MPKRTDLEKILIIGSGPIVIGQACEFDYSGTQACKALKEEGYEVVLVNSNPATIMTDPETADRTYVEPITPPVVARILEKERPQALLPTLGGQTGLNTAVELADSGVLERLGVEMIGASSEVIHKAEDRERFRAAMERIGLRIPRSAIVRSMDEARAAAAEVGYPLIVRPSFTLGGTGGGVVYNREDLEEIAARGLELSLIHEVMLEESVIGWKEFELEVMRDAKDNVVIVCSIENLDPMGVHTGDSITVAPAQTLSDREYQAMRDAALAIIREIGVETGGSNIQFAVNPENGEMVVIEMNPRVSRSSALASKATGFPIAKIAAKLAVGYTLDEIPNDITRETMASFEPTIDYCVVKIPRWTFEKFPETEDVLTTAMKSVGETMAIGRTFREALQKGLRSLEIGRAGLGFDGRDPWEMDGRVPDRDEIARRLRTPNSQRIFYLPLALEQGFSIEEIRELTGIDPWFLHQIDRIREEGARLRAETPETLPKRLPHYKREGFSDRQVAHCTGLSEAEVRELRQAAGLRPVYKLVDTCAAEFEAYTPYYYSTYEAEDEARPSDRRKVMILGGGPNRIGQGIEFDYCCVHAAFALREEGFESIMVNSNPETVSTDYDTSDKLYFEPLTLEDVLHIVETERPEGVIVQFGGQTPLNLAVALEAAGVPILGTSPASIDRAEDRKSFQAMLHKLDLVQPANGTATTLEGALAVAAEIGYPVVVRPSYVLGGRAMRIVYDEGQLRAFMREAVQAAEGHPILVDQFLQDAIEVDVDAVSDGRRTLIAGIMEHIEEAGIHSGDSACVLPPRTLGEEILRQIAAATRSMAAELGVVGLMNVQYAVKDGRLYVLEVNPRASRTVPFVSKATGIPWAKVATRVMVGRTLDALGLTEERIPGHTAVKESVFPFRRFPGVDTVLGPEMKSTGEVMGLDGPFGLAFAKSQLAAGLDLPTGGTAFLSIKRGDKEPFLPVARALLEAGFHLIATHGTALYLSEHGIPAERVLKVSEGRPNVLDKMKNGEVQLVINTPSGRRTRSDAYYIRRAALELDIPYFTTVAGARAAAEAIAALRRTPLEVRSLQEYYEAGTVRAPYAA
ncbi:carbamoyl-phosphate synthase large subunit [Dissulfurirhabdus thermomarina]|uniref:Carbamoyl phosphate synthase large chain n=1 Tax=Dissulfurirhabdus thermomarina TaxID=1765737 RepID=A0A6N9TU68_DISTH|nr:carbamoyl-phosphate synthase large subunit [Dissulfurirhabdus thermomarina]NDY42046.1 carbamoyl-phosphate synthase large subunit [Dissulfurirhabdus thermomarina]NMX22338.1 carbamoyl-phosphate synthase large subunit [Dissulfurirhabdus thermomarina]